MSEITPIPMDIIERIRIQYLSNNTVLSLYRQEYDTIAQRIYEEALPGYNIVGIDVIIVGLI